MSYIGIPPQANFSSGLLDRFTSTTGTTVTLTHDIASENDIVVFVNFVKQDSTTYSVGGTGNKTLTLGGTLVSSDIVEVHYLNIVGQTNAPSAGSVTTTTINDTAVTGAKLNTDIISAQTELATAPASTDELLVSDAGVLKRVDVSLVGGNNTPAFHAYLNTTQTISDDTVTVVQFNTESFDTDNCYDNSTNFRFLPTTAGKYYVYAAINHNPSSSTNVQQAGISIRKNGSGITENFFSCGTNKIDSVVVVSSIIVDLNGSSDYVDVTGSQAISSGTNRFTGDSTQSRTYFGGYKIIT